MDYNFKHFLIYDSERIEVLEPIGFDASSFIVEQDKKKWGRDIYKGNEEISLEFGNEIGTPLDTQRVLNNGMILRHKNSGLDLLLNANNEFGAEAVVLYEIEKDNVSFTVGELDFGTAETDNLTYIKLKVIQETELAKIKRREKIKIDAFSDKDLDKNTITPIQTHKLFMKAKPITQSSEWESNGVASTGLARYTASGTASSPIPTISNLNSGVNNANEVNKYGIENTLSFISNNYALNSIGFPNDGLNFTYLEAVNELTNIKINITDIVAYSNSEIEDESELITSASGNVKLVIKYGFDSDNGTDMTSIELYNRSFGMTALGNESVPTSFTDIEIPLIQRGMRLYIYFAVTQDVEFDYDPFSTFDLSYEIRCFLESMNVDITATSTSISSTIDAVRYIDLIKQNYKGIGANSVIAPKFDVGGQFYNNFCFNGKLIRQLTNEPFYLQLDETTESLQEFCADSQVLPTSNFIGQYTDYYANVDLGGFIMNPDKDFKITKNDNYLINQFTFGYKKYQKDNDESNTLDAIHTDSEWFVPNNKSSDEKKITLPFARDHYLAEYLRRRAVNNTSADIDDDTIFIFDVIELAPNSRESFTAVLKFEKDDTANTFKLLANDSFSWNLLGFQVGNTIKVDGINYLVNEITSTLLTLNYTTSGNSQGEQVFTIDYPLTNVQYTIRTSEGLTFSENLLNSDVYGNLRYSIKRNIANWFPYLATAGKFILNKTIDNSYFKSNGNCTTQFTGELEPIKENESIEIQDITDLKVINQNVINTTLTISFERAKELIEKLQDVSTLGGFIRCQNQKGGIFKGYIRKLDYNFKYNEMDLTLEERNESDFLDVVYSGSTLTINEVGYDTKVVTEKRYNIFNNYLQFFDENNVFLCNRTKFDKISFNGIVYDSIDELVIAIDNA
jgi:hypothetical protein